MRIAFVVQRYGAEVNGGAEQHCRMVAERLAKHPDVEAVTVLTTCAMDYATWANHYPAGRSVLNGVHVERFEVWFPRLRRAQSLLRQLLTLPHPRLLEWAWLVAQGPFAPSLLRRLRQVRDDHDVFVFFTYLYFPTALGVRQVRRRLLVPTAHDERPIHYRIFRSVFAGPEAIAFNTAEERAFVERVFDVSGKHASVVGCGVELAEPPNEPPQGVGAGPYILYVGRIHSAKGVDALLKHWAAYKANAGGELRLVLAGGGTVPELQSRDDVVSLGFVSEEQKAALLRHCELLVMPSFLESLSLVMLEAWTVGRPVLVNAACDVTRGHVERSGGGATYRDDCEFLTSLEEILNDRALREDMGRRGRAYVENSYAWEVVEARLLQLMSRIQ